MCDVCCADLARGATLQGEWGRFVWGMTDEGSKIVNNLHAPPLQVPVTSDADTRVLYVQAEGQEGSEGPGKIRFAFDINTPSPWIEVPDIAGGMAMLGADLRWSALAMGGPERFQALKDCDVGALTAYVEDRAFKARLADNAWYRCGHLERKKSVKTLAQAIRAELKWYSYLRAEGQLDQADALLNAMQLRLHSVANPRPPRRKRSRRRNVY